MPAFADRHQAGRLLAEHLRAYRGSHAVILGMARGGVLVGLGVATSLGLPLRALVVRKLGAPHNPELAIGAVSETGKLWFDQALVLATGASESYVQAEMVRQVEEAQRRKTQYGGETRLAGATGIVVDDGIATGASAMVAVHTARDLGADRVILATPVASAQAVATLRAEVDDLIVLETPEPFVAVGLYYANFDQTTDGEVVQALRAATSQAKAEPWMN